MKFKPIVMAVFLVILGTIAQKQMQAQTQVGENPRSKVETGRKMMALPDLVIKEILYEADNKIRVRVMNQGKGSSAACYLALIKLSGGGPASPTEKVWTIKIPALNPGKGYSMPIAIAPKTWIDSAFKARVDRSNQVRESNESNNELFNDDKIVK